MRPLAINLTLLLLTAFLAAGNGCAQPYARSYEPFWRNRLHTLTRSATLAKEAQQAALEEFAAAQPKMDAFIASPETEDPYRDSRRVIARCESGATKSADRVKNVKDNAETIFDEWSRESSQYADPSLRKQSRRELDDVKARTDRLIATLESAEESMQPVLISLKDDALYLKHRRGMRNPPPPAYSAKGVRDRGFAQLRAAIGEVVAECDAFVASFPDAAPSDP